MKKTTFNFIIDAMMFLCIMAMSGIGFLIKFVLLPGRESQIKYGRNVDLLFLSMDRHEWGTIHLILGFVLFGMLIIHVVLHWNMIVNIYSQLIGARKFRIMLAAVFIIVAIILGSFPFMVNLDVQERGQGKGRFERRKEYFGKEKETMEYNPYKHEGGITNEKRRNFGRRI